MLLILNDVAGSEIILILVFVLIFFGAKSIPGLARTLGRTMRQVKDATAEIQNEIKKSSQQMKGDLNLKGIIEETADDIKRPLDQYAQDIENTMKYNPSQNSHIKKSVETKVDTETSELNKDESTSEVEELTKEDKEPLDQAGE